MQTILETSGEVVKLHSKRVEDPGDATVTNDGATVMRKLNIVHPAAKLLADISKSQDEEASSPLVSSVILHLPLSF